MKFSLATLISSVAISSVLFDGISATRLGQEDTNKDHANNNSDNNIEKRKRNVYEENRRMLHSMIQRRLSKDYQKATSFDNHFARRRDPLQDEEGDGGSSAEASADGRTVVVECLESPLFDCPTCSSSLQAEQNNVLSAIREKYPGSNLVSSTQRLMNAIFVQLPLSDKVTTEDAFLSQIEGVKDVSSSGSLEMNAIDAVAAMGGFEAREQFCVTGQGVRVAVLDGGIDYTHKAMGGSGLLEDYEKAYGTSSRSEENRERDGLFPTEVVYDGYDFVGEYTTMRIADPDPIDSSGHGTAVADAVRSVAPGAKLMAVKVCTTGGMACPLFSIIKGLEYALDPNQDGSMDDKVDIINLSLGIPFTSPFYDFLALALERVYALGVLPVVATGNSGNIPYVLGGLSGSPNSISVGATGNPGHLDAGVMAQYSSRGPGENNMMKPDIVAPSDLALAAAGTGDRRYRSISGTSFSAPLVAGAAAVVMERCPDCSPFAVKSLLMNNANRGIRYYRSSQTLSPNTLSGAGQMQIEKTLEADFWAYSVKDVQPSMSLGLINVVADVTIRKTIKVVSLSDKAQILLPTHEWRDPSEPFGDALTVTFSTSRVELLDCNSEALVEVIFKIDASKAPPNFMTSTGWAGFDARRLDMNEFGGHVILTEETTNKDISLPFVAIIRQASNVEIEDPVIRKLSTEGPSSLSLNLVNKGAGTAQIDAFELLVISGDESEGEFGDSAAPNDIRYVGYRVLPVGNQGCTHLVEFAFNTWERKNGRLVSELYGVHIDTDGDGESDLVLYNSNLARENLVVNFRDNEESCTGLPPDHSTSSATTVLRACSEDLGLEAFEGQLGVRFQAIVFSDQGAIVETDNSGEEFKPIAFPKPRLSAPSYDVYPGEVLETFDIDGTGGDNRQFASNALGLMLVTNSFRSGNSTGASTPASEAMILLQEEYNYDSLPEEITADVIEFPQAQNLAGPDCSWKEIDPGCDGSLFGNQEENDDSDADIAGSLENPTIGIGPIQNPMLPASVQLAQNQGGSGGGEPEFVTCAPVAVPRAPVPTRAPTSTPLSIPVQPPGFDLPTATSTTQPAPPISISIVINSSEHTPSSSGGQQTTGIINDIDVNLEAETTIEDSVVVELESSASETATSGAPGLWPRLLTDRKSVV